MVINKIDNEKIKSFTEMVKKVVELKINKENKKPKEVIKGVYLGSIGTAMDKETLHEYGISHILTWAANLTPPFEEDFSYLTIPVLDKNKSNVMIHFEETNEFINKSIENGGNILVHSFAGVSRSSTFILAYLMSEKKMNLAESIWLLKDKNIKWEPNMGFMIQLKAYEMTLFGSWSEVEWDQLKFSHEQSVWSDFG